MNDDETTRHYELIALRWWLVSSVLALALYRWWVIVVALALFLPFFSAARLWREQTAWRRARENYEEEVPDGGNSWSMQ